MDFARVWTDANLPHPSESHDPVLHVADESPQSVGRGSVVPEGGSQLLDDGGVGPLPKVVGRRHILKVVLDDKVVLDRVLQTERAGIPVTVRDHNHHKHKYQIV